MKQLTADIIVVAAGPAGLAAAIAASENGAKVIVFEKANATGGTGNMGMGPFAVGSRIQKESFVDITVKEAFDMHMNYTHWGVNASLVKAYFEKSGDTIEWLQGMGVEFFGAYKYFSSSWQTWHIVKTDFGHPGPRAAAGMFRAMTERAKEQDVEFYLETPVEKLIVENDTVAGVIARENGGEEIEARAKAVIVATGGFGDNPEMIEEYTGLKVGEDFHPIRVPGLKGEGLKMCWEIGAAKEGISVELIYHLPDNMTWFSLDTVMRQPNLLINQEGKRFMDEGVLENATYAGNAIMQQPGRCAYAIIDDRIKRYYMKHGLDRISMVNSPKAINAFDYQVDFAKENKYPYFFTADTIEELAEKIGVNAEVLQETIDNYNDMCEDRYDSEFGKNPEFLRQIGKGKLYAAKFYPSAYGSIGGLKINEYCQVINTEGRVISGLYAAGTDANTIYGQSYYNFFLPGNSMGFAINTGRIAGEMAAEEADC